MVRFPLGAGNFSLHHRVQNGSGAHPASYPMVKVLRTLSLRVKRLGCEAGHSPPSSAEVKNAWSCTSTPQYVFMAGSLVKPRDNFTFTFIERSEIGSESVDWIHVAQDKDQWRGLVNMVMDLRVP
jgi:hypothetical protein